MGTKQTTKPVPGPHLQGDDGFEYFIRKYETLLGRRSSSAQADVVLGDNMNLSRKHAAITYNFDKGVLHHKHIVLLSGHRRTCRLAAKLHACTSIYTARAARNQDCTLALHHRRL